VYVSRWIGQASVREIDHVVRFEDGGPTVQANGRVGCPQHNPGRRRPYQPPPPDDD
jgi:hypothetical protein